MARTRASLLAMAAALLTIALMAGVPYTPKPVVHTALIQEGALVQSVLLSGVVRYQQEKPCLSLKAGRVEKVHARAGQTVNKGDLLFQLDCSAEQEVLSACIQARRQREALGQAAAAFALEGQLSLSQLESQARAGIAASQIRAEADGVVENVYAQAGSYVQQGELLGWMRGTELCVQSSGDTERLAMVRAGAAAVLSTGEAVQLQSMDAPTAENQQQLVFVPLKEDGLTERRVGETVTIEMLSGPVCNAALVPLAAVSANGEIWFVENGRARSETVDVSRRNADYVAVSAEWLGRSVVLAPDEAQLKQGCAVKEAGRK